MPFTGTTFAIINSFVGGTTILSSQVNQNYTDIASGLTALAAGTQYVDKVELGHATDTTLTRVSAGVMAVEGKSILGGVNCSFSAHKNGSDQAIATTAATKITFGTEVFDVGTKFATSTWTPVAGTCSINVNLAYINITAGEIITLHIYKNGASFIRNLQGAPSATFNYSISLSLIDQCNGTDTYEVYTSCTDSAYTIEGDAVNTRFMGTMV